MVTEQHVLRCLQGYKACKGLKTRGHTEEGSPLGDADIGIRIRGEYKRSERGRVLEALLAG